MGPREGRAQRERRSWEVRTKHDSRVLGHFQSQATRVAGGLSAPTCPSPGVSGLSQPLADERQAWSVKNPIAGASLVDQWLRLHQCRGVQV